MEIKDFIHFPIMVVYIILFLIVGFIKSEESSTSNSLLLHHNHHHSNQHNHHRIHGSVANSATHLDRTTIPKWLVNFPLEFLRIPANLPSDDNHIRDVRNNTQEMKDFSTFYTKASSDFVDWAVIDGESIDVIEHFFWGMKDGIAIELGALDGSVSTNSMTVALEESLGWRRILIEADPKHRNNMKFKSPLALSVNAAICNSPVPLHYVSYDYVGGILEFMSPELMRIFHRAIYNAGHPRGNVTSITDWKRFTNVYELECVYLQKVLRLAHVSHVNYFLLDVEGAELTILKTINWSKVTFDVISVETDPGARPANYSNEVREFLGQHDYYDCCGQVGRNLWFLRKGFEPSMRPGLDKNCWNGYLKVQPKRKDELAKCEVKV